MDPVAHQVGILKLFPSEYPGLRDRTSPPPEFLLWLTVMTYEDVYCLPEMLERLGISAEG